MRTMVACRLEPDLYSLLKQMAEIEHRSVSQQMAYLLAKQLEAEKRAMLALGGGHWLERQST